jgi:glycosyltransferase involved in cell wall biosynthesis
LKKALIVDWFDKYGGAERVIGKFEKIFSFDKTYTLVNIMEKEYLLKIYPKKTEVIKETFLKYFKKKFRLFFFTFHCIIRTIKIDKDVELIISSSHAVAKGIKKSNPNQLHISYFQARNFNYIWSDFELYFGKFRFFIYPLILILRKIDIQQSVNPDFIICNSIFVKDWVKKVYKRNSDVIYPPVDLKNFNLETEKEDYYICVGRLVYVKRFDIAIRAFNKLNKKLIIIGDGDQADVLKKIASKNIIFKGFLDSTEVSNYIKNAKGFIQTGVEGFGIAPIEAQACGTPVIAFAQGGVLETVINNKTGIFFNEQSESSLLEALEKFKNITFNPIEIRENALKFSSERFEYEIKSYIDKKWSEHQKNIPQSKNVIN